MGLALGRKEALGIGIAEAGVRPRGVDSSEYAATVRRIIWD